MKDCTDNTVNKFIGLTVKAGNHRLAGFTADTLPMAGLYDIALSHKGGAFRRHLTPDELGELDHLTFTVEYFRDESLGSVDSYRVFSDGSLHRIHEAQNEVWKSGRDFILSQIDRLGTQWLAGNHFMQRLAERFAPSLLS